VGVTDESQGPIYGLAAPSPTPHDPQMPNPPHQHAIVALCLALIYPSVMAPTRCLADAGEVPNWPQFRGPNASGVDSTGQPPIKIGPEESVLWKVEVPWAPSSPIVWGDRLFLTSFRDGELETRCHRTGDGKLLWAKAVKPVGIEDFHRSDGSPAASTPATDGKHVVSYFGSFGILCYNLEGEEQWRHPLPIALSGGKYGTGTSPIIVGGRVILNRDQHRGSALLALDLETGKRLWETPRPDAAGSFGTPVHWENAGHDEIVVAASGRLKGYDLKTGEERWHLNGITGFVCTTPVIGDSMLYFAAFSNGQQDSPLPEWGEFLGRHDKDGDGEVAVDEIENPARDYYRGLDLNRDGKYTKQDWDAVSAAAAGTANLMVAIEPGGTGDIADTHVAWEFSKGLPYVPSPLFYDGRIYLVKDGGIMSSIDAESGDPVYSRERIGASGDYYASPVAAGEHLYVASLSGTLSVVKAGGDEPELLHQVEFDARILATPAVVGDRIYLRTSKHLFAFGS
ncbi:MAG: PQQ-binding-like beta-propeller repeat protein, partial [Verrucomicrobiales bacterium]